MCGKDMHRNRKSLKLTMDDVEIGYLAIHIERVMDNELSEQQ